MRNREPFDPLRRRLVGSALAAAVVAAVSVPVRAADDLPTINVWKSPTCGCCKDWIRHLEDNGFPVTFHDEGNWDARERLGMPVKFGSCHTGEVDGYAIEGHVPASDIKRLLDEKPDAIGLSVPAMPRGSPGMDGPQYGGVIDPYDVLLIERDGTARVFESYR